MLAPILPRAPTFVVDYRPPFDWPATLAYFAARATPGVETVDGTTYWRTVRLGDHIGAIGVSHDADRFSFCVRYSASLTPVRARLRASVRRLFDLDIDPRPIMEHLSTDVRLAPVVRQHAGLRVPGAVNGFDLAVRAILGQQVSVRGASTLAGRLVAAVGERVPDDVFASGYRHAALTHLAPSAERLADAGVQRIAAIGLPRSRAETLAHFGRKVAEGLLGDLSPEDAPADVVDRMLALPGIGPWTAQYVALRALRDPDAFPESDLGLRKAMGGMSVTAVRRAAERWRPWRGYAAIHLWTSLG